VTTPKAPLDELLVGLGLAPSLERARALILAGKVLVGDKPATKAGERFVVGSPVRLRGGAESDFASRGALKLAPALDAFGVQPDGLVCLDIGASTGGFTDILLRRGAARVYAVDVGYGLLDWRIRSDGRVVVLDRTNARLLSAAEVPELAALAVIDVSFISVTKILQAVAGRVSPGGRILVMVKPQFEASRSAIGAGGVVRDEVERIRIIDGVAGFAAGIGLRVLGRQDNEVHGPKGNIECFLCLAVGG
jgi:23S rRNA (cytidine1920-2'-O)/16S rRNA (cytidine1409-2'-O)-methyltransferase